MKKTLWFQCGIVMLFMFFTSQVYAFEYFAVICGDGEKIEIVDSEYNPSGIALACLTSGHPPPQPARVKPEFTEGYSLYKAGIPYKRFEAKYLKEVIAKGSGKATPDVDHSDILLMLQGCECLSPSCVAYLCPVDVDIP